MSKTTLQFFGGLRTIGGTVVELKYGDSRVIFDFGLVYSPQTNIFDGQVKLRKQAIVRDYLKLGLMPNIDGVFRKADLPANLNILSAEEYEGNTAVIISHLHLDHIGAMGFIHPDIPIYMTDEALKLYKTLELIGEGVLGEPRTYQSCTYNEPFYVGQIKITPIQVDHDTVGACAFHIETPDGAIIYSGDVRMHGAHPERIESFIEKAKELGFDAAIIEGTTLRSEEELPSEAIVANKELPEDLVTELMIPEKMSEVLKTTQGLGLFNIYHRNIDRIEGIIKAGKNTGRKVVFEAGTAQIALNLLNTREFYIYESEELRAAKESNSLPKWVGGLLEEVPTVSYKEINANPGQYFFQNSYENSLELFDLNVKDGIYIHSNGVPLGEFDPAYENLNRVLQLIDLEKVLIGTGGHAIPQHLKYIVDELDPKVLIPLHSFYPERLTAKNGIQLLPSYGKVYRLGNGSIVEE